MLDTVFTLLSLIIIIIIIIIINTKQFYRYLGAKTIAMKQPHMEEVESYWKSLWEEKVKHNEEAEWIRR
jgi:hypothetical protein